MFGFPRAAFDVVKIDGASVAIIRSFGWHGLPIPSNLKVVKAFIWSIFLTTDSQVLDEFAV